MINFYKMFNDQSLDLYAEKNVYISAFHRLNHPTLLEEFSDFTEQELAVLRSNLHVIKKSSGLSYKFARSVLRGRWYEAEPTILTNPLHAYFYSNDVIDGPWPEAEPIIMTSSGPAYCYAAYILERRWKEGEPAIMQTPRFAYQYARDILSNDEEWLKWPGHDRGRWPEAEPHIRKSSAVWDMYVREIII